MKYQYTSENHPESQKKIYSQSYKLHDPCIIILEVTKLYKQETDQQLSAVRGPEDNIITETVEAETFRILTVGVKILAMTVSDKQFSKALLLGENGYHF